MSVSNQLNGAIPTELLGLTNLTVVNLSKTDHVLKLLVVTG